MDMPRASVPGRTKSPGLHAPCLLLAALLSCGSAGADQETAPEPLVRFTTIKPGYTKIPSGVSIHPAERMVTVSYSDDLDPDSLRVTLNDKDISGYFVPPPYGERSAFLSLPYVPGRNALRLVARSRTVGGPAGNFLFEAVLDFLPPEPDPGQVDVERVEVYEDGK